MGDDHLAHDTPVAVVLVPDHVDLTAEDQIRKVLFGALAERLFLLWRINARKPNLELLVISVEHGDGVSVADADDFACEGGCIGLPKGKKCNASQRAP